MDAVEEIKQRLLIEDVVADYIELKRAGRNFKALSPFNAERTPSLMISPDKQIWHDFSSGKGGNMFGFVMEMEGLDFKGALEILARKAGVDLSLYQKGDATAKQNKDKAQAALELATKYYQQTLLKNDEALKYVLKKRHFNRQTLNDFRLGYSPNTQNALVDFLKKRGFDEGTLKLAGLTAQRYNGLGDMFRGRIMIPLMDPQGSPIGFTARILTDDPEAPKYINTPQTMLYDKSRHVFGLHLAKDEIRRSGFVVVVEGNLDVIASHQAGYKNVVATAGTALTAYHLKTLQRFTSDIRLSFDQDRAGIAAAERAIATAQDVHVQLSIITIEKAKDPDELIQKNPSLWEKAIHSQQYAMDWLMARYQNIYDITTAHGKRTFTDVLLETIARLEDSVEQDHYLLELAKLTEVSEGAMRSKLATIKGDGGMPIKRSKVLNIEHVLNDPYVFEDQLLCLQAAFPITRRLLETEAEHLVFSTPERQRIYEYIEANPHISLTDSIPEDLKDVEDYVKILLFKAEELYSNFDANERLRELRDLTHKLTGKHQKHQKQELTVAIRTAEQAGNEKLVAQLLEEFNNLLKKEQ
jgi:DNA primase